MSRESRQHKLEQRLEQLEGDYTRILTAALDECRRGRWGLFGKNDHLLKLESPADKLTGMGESIRELRRQLGIAQAFPAHERFLHYRSFRGPNVPGEPKLAEALWRELELPPAH
jgi:hypothetical protein